MTDIPEKPAWDAARPDIDQMFFELTDVPHTFSYPILGEITVDTKPRFDTFYLNDVNKQSRHSERRRISDPNESMIAIHQQFVGRLRRMEIDRPYATGGAPGCSTVKNVARHVGNRYFYQIDISSAYERVDTIRLAVILCLYAELDEADYPQVVEFLEKFCIDPKRGGLYTGSPSSPDLFNLYMLPVDDVIAEIAQRHGMTYSRYIDDLTFSSPDTGKEERDRIGKRKRHQIRDVLETAGLPLSHGKSRNDDIRKGPVTITGIQLNPSGHWQLPTHSQREIVEVLREIELEQASGLPLNEQASGMLAGMNGLLQSSIDRRRVIYTRPEHQIMRLYERIVAREKRNRKRAGLL